ncbi:hypothetical protein GSI_10869 [Ganoderma sinense ZZ0214-1]|uniref:Uncharacterized protein n=1 Tax=Ganoderma sinense ZZ0214-1 TaxID=1077348 RepID=A0A2G8S1S5_9APHY|nr:hypothetical protein GSI_10869 [Ganoderma sinense ZZ0214-1]
MKFSILAPFALAALVSARPASLSLTGRASGNCTKKLINFDDPSIEQKDSSKVEVIQNPFNGFNWDGFGFTTCPGAACCSFPANVTQQFTAPRLAMAEGLVGGLLIGKLDLATSPKGSFDLGPFDVFDIIDLPLGAEEDMRVHLDCTSAGDGAHAKLTIPFDRNKDSAGYSVTQDKLGDKFVGLSGCTITTTQVFFPLGHELEIPTESMGLDNLNVCMR